jgi:phosphoserine phosphatase
MTDPLPSWHDGRAKQAILAFVKATTTPGDPKFVPLEDRIAAFDQDGTTWVEQPQYAQVMFTFDQLAAAAAKNPNLTNAEPFKTMLSGDAAAIAKLGVPDLLKAVAFTHSGMTVEIFQQSVRDWIATAKHPRYRRLYTELVYQPMLEVMHFVRANGYRTIFVTGGGQDFVRVYAEQVYGVSRELVVGSAGGTTFSYDDDGRAILTKDAKLLWVDDKEGKPVQIHQAIGRRPVMAFGNSDGDEHMLEYTEGGDGPRFMMLIHHDDAAREYDTDSIMSVFSPALMELAEQRGWTVTSMKNDWKKIFAWE